MDAVSLSNDDKKFMRQIHPSLHSEFIFNLAPYQVLILIIYLYIDGEGYTLNLMVLDDDTS